MVLFELQEVIPNGQESKLSVRPSPSLSVVELLLVWLTDVLSGKSLETVSISPPFDALSRIGETLEKDNNITKINDFNAFIASFLGEDIYYAVPMLLS